MLRGVVSLASQTAWLAASALILLASTELLGIALSWVNPPPVCHVFSIAVDTRPIATLLDYASRPIDPDDYNSVAATAVGAEATLLALFFATVGVVASTAYSSVPGDIRGLFVESRVSNIYTRGIVRALVFTAALLTLGALGHQARVPTVVTAALLAILAALRLLVAGTAPFNFFDPAALTETLPTKFARALKIAAVQPLSTDQGHQRQSHRDARTVLEHYSRIADLLTSRSTLNSDAPLKVARQLLALNKVYSAVKERIPSDSRWWGRMTSYPNWFTLSGSQLQISLSTSTGVQGTVEADHLWVERQSVSDIGQLLGTHNGIRLSEFTTFIDEATEHVRRLARRLQIAEAQLFEEQLATAIWSAVDSQPAGDDNERFYHSRDRIVASQRSVLLLTNIWLGIVDAADLIRTTDFSGIADQAIATGRQIEGTPCPRAVVGQIETFRDRLGMERRVEGHAVTPSWWLHHHLARTLTTELLDGYRVVISRFTTHTLPAVRAALKGEDWEVATMTALAALELFSKIESLTATVSSALNTLETARSSAISDPYWPAIASEPTIKLSARREILQGLGVCLPRLNADPHNTTRLDLFGQTYTFLHSATFEAILDNDVRLAPELFAVLFEQRSAASSRIIRDLAGKLPSVQVAFAMEPIVGMAELSGYAILIQELNGSGSWDKIREIWESDRRSRGDKAVVDLATMIGDAGMPLMPTPHDLMRQNRRQRLADLLNKRGLTPPDDGFWPGSGPPARQQITSPIVTAFVRGHRTMWKLTDLFMAIYVRPFLPQGTELPRSAQSLAVAIDNAEGGQNA